MIQEKIEELREIPFQCHLVNLKSHTDWPECEQGPPW
jgi:hypothetical protein